MRQKQTKRLTNFACKLAFAVFNAAVFFVTSSIVVQAADNSAQQAITSSNQVVNVYSARKEALIKPLLDKFSEQHGITVNLVTGKGDALLTRLKSEARNSPADLLITTDAGRLVRAKNAGVLFAKPIKELETIIPPKYRDKEGYWYGLSLRARVIVFAKDRVSAQALSNYENLADPVWKGRLCVRSSSNIYNQSLVASMLAHRGAKQTQTWLSGLVSNFARPPSGGDRDQIKAVATGQCDIALVNSYYLGAMLQSADQEQRVMANKVSLFWPNQLATTDPTNTNDSSDRGVHINISGAGITSAAPNRENAIKLLMFLANKQSQQWYGEVNNEFPVRADVPASTLLLSWGNFKADSLPVSMLGDLNTEAVKAMDRAHWQ